MMSKIAEKKTKPQNNNKISSVITDSSNTEDFMSSVSNPDSTNRNFEIQQDVNNLGVINLRGKNLNHHGAYLLSQRIKRDYSIIQSIDLSNNQLEDEGILYLSMSLRLCTHLNSLNLSNNLITEYGVRILLENLNYRFLKYLNLSGNFIGIKGIEHIAKYIPSIQIEHLTLNSSGIEEEGAKALGFSLMSSNWLKALELSWNNIKGAGSVLLCRGLIGNNSVEEIYLSYNNNFGYDGAVAMAECLKLNKTLKLIDLTSTKLNYDCAKILAQGLKVNSTLQSLILGHNSITGAGVFEILRSINTETSGIEYLGLRNIPIQKHMVLIIELIQQRRKFNCDHGNIVIHPDTPNIRISSDDESMIKLAKFLAEKRMRLVDLFRVLDKEDRFELDKTEFIRRMKIFEPRLTQKDITTIAKNMTSKDTIYYSTLFSQMTKPRPDNQFELNRKRAQLNEEEDRMLNKFNKNLSLKKLAGERPSRNRSGNNDAKFKEIDNWLESQNLTSNISDFDSEKDLKKLNENQTKKVKLPLIITDSSDRIENLDKRFSKSDPSLNQEKGNETTNLVVKTVRKIPGRFSSQSNYRDGSKKLEKRKGSIDPTTTAVIIETTSDINKLNSLFTESNKNINLTNERKSVNLQAIEASLV